MPVITTEEPNLSATTESNRHQWFAEEVQALLPRLMGTALRLTRDRTDAEDLVADAVATGWSKLDSLDDRAALGSWLCRILTNAFISRGRSAAAKAEVESFTEVPEEGEGFSLFERLHQPFLLWRANPERDFLNRLLREDLEAAIDSLPDAFRVAVVLVDVQGFSYHEASASLGVPVGTVRSRLARGRSRLQEALWKQAVDAGYRPAQSVRRSMQEEEVTTEPGQGSDMQERGAHDE